MKYTVVIEKVTGNYSAFVPGLPGCVATGETIAEVKAEISAAIRFHLNHQFHAVRAAVERVVQASRPSGDRKGGVVWHTQAAGKSIEMACLAGISW